MEWLWYNEHVLSKRNFLQVTAAFLTGFRLDLRVWWGVWLTDAAATAAAASSTHIAGVEEGVPSSSDSTFDEAEGDEITEVGDDGGVEYTEPPDDNDDSDKSSWYSVKRIIRVDFKSCLDTHSSFAL